VADFLGSLSGIQPTVLMEQFIVAYGLWAVFLLLFAENVLPILPSEVVIPVAALVAVREGQGIWETVIAASVGAMLGQMPWYWAARWLGYARFRRFASRYGRFTTIGPDEVDKASAWFHRHGQKAVFLGRITPVIRGIISVPAGLTSMPLGTFLAWSIPGSTLWVVFLAWIGKELGKRGGDEVQQWLHPVSTALVAFAIVAWLYRIVTFHSRQRKRPAAEAAAGVVPPVGDRQP